jgi:hypothetical protein
MFVSLGLALVAALVYILMGAGVLKPGDLTTDEAPPGIAYIAAAGYIMGGFLILLKKRGLWITGAVINALVIIMFYAMHSDRPAVLSSAAGIITKVAQIPLEAGLIFLITKSGTEKRATTAK